MNKAEIEIGAWYLVPNVLRVEDRSYDYPGQVTGVDQSTVFFDAEPEPGWVGGSPLFISKKLPKEIQQPFFWACPARRRTFSKSLS